MKTTRTPFAKRRGTTLIEVMLAATMLVMMAAIAVAALMYPSLLIISDSRRQAALHEAGRAMELAKAADYKNISPTNYTLSILNKNFDVSRSVVSNATEQQITLEVKNGDGDLVVQLLTERTP